MAAKGSSRTHSHDDAPDTAETFKRITELPDGQLRQALRDDVIRQWLPTSEQLALRFRGRGESMEDLFQVAALGLVKAVDGYDPGRGRAFESYAIPTITDEIKRHFRDHMWTLHVPRRVQELRNRVRSANRELYQTGSGETPTVAEIAAHAHMSEEEAHTGMGALECFSALSLDAEVTSAEGFALGDSMGALDPGLDLAVNRVTACPAIAALPDRDRTILYLRFFRGMTQSAIAEQLGISQMHVSRLLSGVLDRLREELLSEQGWRRNDSAVA